MGRCWKMGHVADVSPKNMTDRPIREGHMDRDQLSNARTRMDPLSDLLGSMSIQEAVYKRLEATAPWGIHYAGDPGPRIRFGLVARGSALLRFKNSRRTFSLSAGDLFIFILSDEPFTLMDHPRSPVVASTEALKLELESGVIRYGGGGAITTLVAGGESKSRLPIRTRSIGDRNCRPRYSFLVLDRLSLSIALCLCDSGLRK